MSDLIQSVLSGLSTGSLYALAALGLVLLFRTTHVTNFAQGEMAMFTAFFTFTLMERINAPLPVAIMGGVVFAAIMGLLIDRILMRPLMNSPVLSRLIVTLGLIMFLNGVGLAVFGSNTYPFPRVIEGETIKLLGAGIRPNAIFIIGVSLFIMFCIFYFYKFTIQGLAIRATSQNTTTSKLMGIDTSRVYSLTWMVSISLAGIAGILIAPTTNLHLGMMGEIHLKSLTAAVLGGFTSYIGPVLGGLILGILENLVGLYISDVWKTAFSFGAIVLILVAKPEGLFGKRIRKKV